MKIGYSFIKRNLKLISLKKHFDISPTVFYPTALVSILFVVVVLIVGKPASIFFSNFQTLMSSNLGWMVTLIINITLITVIYFGIGNYGKLKLGGKNATPEFSTFSWVAMLFSAGMGIGLLYFSVAEPMYHFNNPLSTDLNLKQKITHSMNTTFLHYGFHVWAIYCLVGLALAYSCFNKGRPLSLGGTIVGILPKNNTFITRLIDSLAALATLFGLATSLGFGARQFCSGLESLVGLPNTPANQVLSIVVITIIATISIVTGLKKGVRILSNLNIILALLLFFFVLTFGPSIKLLDFFIQSTGNYLKDFIGISFERGALDDNSSFLKGWSMFYWAWWISWSPFVGTFIARISKGRTIREFVLFVLFIPTLVSFIWLGVFGGLAFDLQIAQNLDVAKVVAKDSSKALFFVLETLPLSSFISGLAITLVATFFITSSDSGSLVVDYMTSGGKLDAPNGQKIFWASMEGAIAIALIAGGGLSALQAASISTGFPFAIFLLFMAYALKKELSEEINLKHRKN
tara:strand:- start:52 stop:1605 length:1554 start_codon:yes stop_codon:yes gene_type:complete